MPLHVPTTSTSEKMNDNRNEIPSITKFCFATQQSTHSFDQVLLSYIQFLEPQSNLRESDKSNNLKNRVSGIFDQPRRPKVGVLGQWELSIIFREYSFQRKTYFPNLESSDDNPRIQNGWGSLPPFIPIGALVQKTVLRCRFGESLAFKECPKHCGCWAR